MKFKRLISSLTIFLTFSLVSFSQLNIDSLEVIMRDWDMKVIAENGIKYDTVYLDRKYNYAIYSDNNRLLAIGNIDNSLIANGHWVYFDEKGNCVLKGTAKNGRKTGTWTDCNTYANFHEEIKYNRKGKTKRKTTRSCW